MSVFVYLKLYIIFLIMGFAHLYYANRSIIYTTDKEKSQAVCRIVGGQNADIKDFPFSVALQTIKRRPHCGGTLIRPDWVLTAAHCLVDIRNIHLPIRDVRNYILVMGSADVRSGKEAASVQLRKPSLFIPHTEFDQQYMVKDIGLVKVSNNFVLTEEVQPVALPESVIMPARDEMCTVIGWGRLNDPKHDCGNPLLPSLQMVDVPIIDLATCQYYYSADTVHEQINLCAGYEKGEKDACNGDSGGPLLCRGMAIGIVSWGNGCAQPRYPGVYSKIDYYLHWINGTISRKYWPESSKTVSGCNNIMTQFLNYILIIKCLRYNYYL